MCSANKLSRSSDSAFYFCCLHRPPLALPSPLFTPNQVQQFTASPAQNIHQITHKTNDFGNVPGVRRKRAIIEPHGVRTNIMHTLILSHYVCIRHTDIHPSPSALTPFFHPCISTLAPRGGWFDCMCGQFCRLRHIDHSRDEESREGKAVGCLSFSASARLLRSSMAEIQFECGWKHWISAIFGGHGGIKWKLSECKTLRRHQCWKAKMFKMLKEIR